MIPSADTNSGPSDSVKNSISSKQPSSSGNSDDVTVTPEPSAHEPPVSGVGEVGGGGEGVGSEPLSSSHPQLTPNVVDVAKSMLPPGNSPVCSTATAMGCIHRGQ